MNDHHQSAEERKTLAGGIRWPRFIFAFLGFFILLDTVMIPTDLLFNISQLMLCIMLYFFFYKIRRLMFDKNNLYIVKGKDEIIVPLKSIVSIKKSSTKVNGERYYKIKYVDEFNIENTRRYLPGWFGESKNFIAAVKKANPDVIHWSHPFFNH